MSAHSAQTASGTTPVRIRRPKIWQPTQKARIDSSPAATTTRPSSRSVPVVAPASQTIVAAVVIAAPMPCAKRFGGPGTYLGSPSRGAATRVANRPSGLSVGPVSTRAQKPYVSGTSSQYADVRSAASATTITTPATTRAAFSLTGFGNENIASNCRNPIVFARYSPQPPSEPPLPPPGEVGGGSRADRHRGQVAARGQGANQGRLRRAARRRGLAAQRPHPAVRAGVARE